MQLTGYGRNKIVRIKKQLKELKLIDWKRRRNSTNLYEVAKLEEYMIVSPPNSQEFHHDTSNKTKNILTTGGDNSKSDSFTTKLFNSNTETDSFTEELCDIDTDNESKEFDYHEAELELPEPSTNTTINKMEHTLIETAFEDTEGTTYGRKNE